MVVMAAFSVVPCAHQPAWGIPAPHGHLLPLDTAAPVAQWRHWRTLATIASPLAPSSPPCLCFDSSIGEPLGPSLLSPPHVLCAHGHRAVPVSTALSCASVILYIRYGEHFFSEGTHGFVKGSIHQHHAVLGLLERVYLTGRPQSLALATIPT